MASPSELREIQILLDKISKTSKRLDKEMFKGVDAKAFASGVTDSDVAIKSLEETLKSLNGELARTEVGLKDLGQRIRDVIKEAGQGDVVKETAKSLKKLGGLMVDIEDVHYNISKANIKDVRTIKAKVNLEFDRLQRRKNELKTEIESGEIEGKRLERAIELYHLAKDSLKEQEDKIGYQDDFNTVLDKTISRVQRINRATGLTGSIVAGLGKMFDKIGFQDMSEEIHIARDKMRDLADEITDGGRKSAGFVGTLRVGLKGMGSLLGSIGRQLRDPLIVIGLIVKAFKELWNLGQAFAKETADVGKRFLGLGKQSKEIALNLREAATGAGGLYLSIEETHKAMSGLNTVASTQVQFSNKTLQNYKELTHDLGLSEEAAQNLFLLSTQSGKGYRETADQILGIAQGLNLAHGSSVDVGAVMKDVLGASAGIRVNLNNNIHALSTSAFYARRLGMSMDEIKAASESTLDFESSIAKELEAELLLGKELNLESYRYYALTGKTDLAAKELNRELMKNKDAIKGNVIVAQSFAASLGMSTDQLYKSVEQAELQAEISKLGYKDRVGALETINRLMEKGLSKNQALVKLQKEGLDTIIKEHKTSELNMRLLQDAKERLQTTLLPIATKIANFMADIFSPERVDRLGNILKNTVGVAVKFIAEWPKASMLAVAAGLTAMALRGTFAMPTKVWVVNQVGGLGKGGGVFGAPTKYWGGGRGLLKGGAFGLAGLGAGMATSHGVEHLEKKGMDTEADVANAFGKAAEFGLYGAAVGSIIPVIGTTAGAITGAIGGGLYGLYENMEKDKSEAEAARTAAARDTDRIVGAIDVWGNKITNQQVNFSLVDSERQNFINKRMNNNL